ncbi:MAG TPA: efflux RND transporter periplasmic adaptor subunit [Hyphomicrobiaceae bacterium]|jgi:multidrug resistance efflux pump
MIAFLVTVYAAVVLMLFKLKLLKPRPYPIAILVLAGVLMLGGVVVAWMQCAPMSGSLVTSQYVVQLVPYNVKGYVKKVFAKANEPLKKGDPLLEIDPAPYRYTVDQIDAQLMAAKANVKQSRANLDAAYASTQKAADAVQAAQAAPPAGGTCLMPKLKQYVGLDVSLEETTIAAQANAAKWRAAYDLAKTEEAMAVNLQKVGIGAIGLLKVDEAKQKAREQEAALQQAQAGVVQAEAADRQAIAALAEARSGVLQAEATVKQAAAALEIAESNVPGIAAQLAEARFNLAQCKMTAPSDGYVVNWQVQEGTMLAPMPTAAAGTFIDTTSISVLAAFPQNYLTNVRPGNDVELVLDAYPGRVFKGTVDMIIPASGGGQLTTSGEIPSAAKATSSGMFAVKIGFDRDADPQPFPWDRGELPPSTPTRASRCISFLR